MAAPSILDLTDAQALLTPTSLVPLLIVLVLVILYRLSLPRPIPGIPYDKKAASSPLGHLPEILAWKKEHDDMRSWFPKVTERLNSPVVQLFVPFQRPQVLVTDFWETNDIILRRSGYHKEFDRGPAHKEIFGPIVPEHTSCIETSDPRFKRNRELTKDLMAVDFINNVSGPSIYDKATVVVDLWKLKAQLAGGRPFDAYKDIHEAVLDFILVASYGLTDKQSVIRNQLDFIKQKASQLSASFKQLDQDTPVPFPRRPLFRDFAALVETTGGLMIGQASPMPWLSYWWAVNFTSLGRALKTREEFITEQIRLSAARMQSEDGDHTARSAVDHVVLREIQAAAKGGREPHFFSRYVLDELFGYFVGGHDTTATTVSWGTKILTDNPSEQTRLRAHLQAIFTSALAQHRQPTVDEIMSATAPYLDAFIEELTRYAGTFPLIIRETRQDNVRVMGHPVPRDTLVIMHSNGQDFIQPGIPVPGDDIEKGDARRVETHHRPDALAQEKTAKWADEDISLFAPRRWLRRKADVNANRFSDPAPGKPRVPMVTEAELEKAGPAASGLEFDPNAGPNLAFGAGVRGCFGRKLAYVKLRIVVTLLVWNFELLPCPPELSTYRSKDSLTRLPRDCYVRLRVLGST